MDGLGVVIFFAICAPLILLWMLFDAFVANPLLVICITITAAAVLWLIVDKIKHG